MGFFERFGKRSVAPFAPSDSCDAFSAYLNRSGLTVAGLDVPSAARAVLDFYGTTRALDCPIDSDGDMLLFQWGVHDWGSGPSFQFNLTRQFILASSEDDSGISQLGLTLHFVPSDDLRSLGCGSEWCHHPDDRAQFELFVSSSPTYCAVSSKAPDSVELSYGGV